MDRKSLILGHGAGWRMRPAFSVGRHHIRLLFDTERITGMRLSGGIRRPCAASMRCLFHY